MCGKGQQALKFYRLFVGSLPKSVPKDIYKNDLETIFQKDLNLNESIYNIQKLYFDTLHKRNEFLHEYRIGIKRDDRVSVQQVAKQVGFILPDYKE